MEKKEMNVTREVILDLLPVYLAGESSPATQALVEEYLKQDAEMAHRIRLQRAELSLDTTLPNLPPELELRSLRRTRRLLNCQRWLFGLAIGFTALSLSSEFSIQGGHLRGFHFLIRDYPIPFGICMSLGLACWIAYFFLRRRLRVTVR